MRALALKINERQIADSVTKTDFIFAVWLRANFVCKYFMCLSE
jgi:hypothetical protein